MRPIDADAMEKTILDFWGCDPAYCMDLNGWDPARADVCTLERLKNAPTIDAVPVVRCRECKHWVGDFPGATKYVKRCEWAGYMVGENGYCVYGERKEDDHE